MSLATNNQYVYGAVVLGRSLRDTGTQRRLALMITEQVTEDMRYEVKMRKNSLLLFSILGALFEKYGTS